MKPMDKIRLYHKDILGFLDIIDSCLSDSIDLETARHILEQLALLSTKLDDHLLLEDNFFYPAFKRRDQMAIRDIAFQFSVEYGGIRAAFMNYSKNWINPEKMMIDYAIFLSETKALFGVLRNRISREETELFPLLES